MLRCWIVLVLFGTMVVASHDSKRQDDGSRVAALETLVQQQAATIQALEARLDVQQNIINNGLGQLYDVNQTLSQRLDQEGAELQIVMAEVLSDHQSMMARLATQEQSAAFYADFGGQSYGDVDIAANQPVKFSRVLTNIGDGYDNTTGVFTVPFSGVYTFYLHFMGGRHSNSTDLGVYAGDQLLALAYAEGDDSDRNDQGSSTAVSHLQKGQMVSVKVLSGDPTIWGYTFTSFSGTLVRSD